VGARAGRGGRARHLRRKGYKTHAKVCLITAGAATACAGIRIPHGNYNERTARVWHRHRLMTSSRALCTDASAVFTGLRAIRIRRVLEARDGADGLRQRFLKLIERERRRAEEGQPCRSSRR
jgi:polyphosphate kinase